MIRRSTVTLLAVLLCSSTVAFAQTAPDAAPAAPKPAASAAPQAAGATAAPVEPHVAPSGSPAHIFLGGGSPPAQSYDTFVHGVTPQSGVIDLLRKDDELYFDLRPQNFDKTYIVETTIARGVGGDAFAGRVYEPFAVRFKRVGKRVLWITPNSHYVADKGSAAANSLSISVGDSVLLSTPIVAEDAKHEHAVVATSLFLTDFEGIGTDLGRSVPASPSIPGLLILSVRPTFAVDPGKSYYGLTKSFPQNDEITANLAFNGPPNAMRTVPDGRGIPVQVHYSIVAPPARDPHFVPRYADDRVGYFITARKRYGNDAVASPFERFIDRWNLDNGPITFYLTNEIPKEYRGTVRRGILAWNAAFAKIGHPNAIVVKDPPSDPGWDPDDARYSTVRWITSDSSNFAAYSSGMSDPDTGQIIRAAVVIDGESLRAVKRGWNDTVQPLQRIRRSAYAADGSAIAAASDEPAEAPSSECAFEEESAAQAALGTALLARHASGTAQREQYAQAWLYATVMHETGHALGLRHNFLGSTAYTQAQLHDPAFTRAHGTTASVMDYTPANLAAPGQRQADYFTDRLGPYDYWAIEYGYRAIPGAQTSAQELPALHRIADRSTAPGLAYGTDEDLMGNPLDPRIARFDLSSDPLAYVNGELRVDDDVVAHLLVHYPGDTRSYQDIRSTLITALNDELSATQIAARYIGGMYTSRAHRDQRGAPPPFAVVPRSQEKRAFDLLDRYVLSSRALRFSPSLLNSAAPDRYGLHWGSNAPHRSDFPVREVTAELQDDAIATLFAPANLARIADEEVKVNAPGQTMSLADLFAWTNAAIYDDVASGAIGPVHADLQRRFTDLQMQIVALPSPFVDQLGLPRETQELARYNLVHLSARIDAGLRVAHDSGTRAHLEDMRARVQGILNARNVRSV